MVNGEEKENKEKQSLNVASQTYHKHNCTLKRVNFTVCKLYFINLSLKNTVRRELRRRETGKKDIMMKLRKKK